MAVRRHGQKIGSICSETTKLWLFLYSHPEFLENLAFGQIGQLVKIFILSWKCDPKDPLVQVVQLHQLSTIKMEMGELILKYCQEILITKSERQSLLKPQQSTHLAEDAMNWLHIMQNQMD